MAVKRGIIAFGCAVAFAAAPLVVAAPAAAKDCPPGTVPRFEGVCTQGQAGGFGAPGLTVPPQTSNRGADITQNPGQIASVSGIPCTPLNVGKCIALQQSQGG